MQGRCEIQIISKKETSSIENFAPLRNDRRLPRQPDEILLPEAMFKRKDFEGRKNGSLNMEHKFHLIHVHHLSPQRRLCVWFAGGDGRAFSDDPAIEREMSCTE